MEEAARRKAEEESKWERAAAQEGGATIETVPCKAGCGGTQAAVATMLSGGTYAQERVQIQKYTCMVGGTHMCDWT
jgi:hypothetical protein